MYSRSVVYTVANLAGLVRCLLLVGWLRAVGGWVPPPQKYVENFTE